MATEVAWIARTQYGRVTYEQLVAAGVGRNRIGRWVADGRLRREHRGVFTLGHPDRSARGLCMSAVLAAGSTAVASHDTAAYLLRIVPGLVTPLEVTIAVSSGRRRPGITIHRSRLHRLDHDTLDGIPITIVPRILLDLAPRLSPQRLSRACHEAWVRHATTPGQVEACIARNPHKPGARKLRHALGADVTLSDLESAFLVLLETHGLPRPRTNIDHRGDKVDCRWPDRDLTVELLSYRYHATRHAFEADVARRRRSNHHAYTYGDVFERAVRTAAEVAALLSTA
ncbi:MAG: type IV toxin-antitoxin system AbiEi family antitoxin domain-containing protein [Solirubrobacteraceae bacterium]|nr:type IV toxin-antitoxin system AbiEi family antitoxin domain-containing protein [Solirubrobacteraceae bacterium]